MRNQEGKIELQKEIHRRICVRQITFLAARAPSYVIFCQFSLPTPSLSSTPILRMKNKFLLHKMVAELVPPASPVSVTLNSNMHKNVLTRILV